MLVIVALLVLLPVVFPTTPASPTATVTSSSSALPPGFVVLNPADYAGDLTLDNVSKLEWAADNVPFFDIDDDVSASSELPACLFLVVFI